LDDYAYYEEDGDEEEVSFDICAGRFWGIVETRPYMRARGALIRDLDAMNTPESTAAALHHLLDCLYLNRGDNQGLRGIAPALFLRLGMDHVSTLVEQPMVSLEKLFPIDCGYVPGCFLTVAFLRSSMQPLDACSSSSSSSSVVVVIVVEVAWFVILSQSQNLQKQRASELASIAHINPSTSALSLSV